MEVNVVSGDDASFFVPGFGTDLISTRHDAALVLFGPKRGLHMGCFLTRRNRLREKGSMIGYFQAPKGPSADSIGGWRLGVARLS
jgi:hypothetical protein